MTTWLWLPVAAYAAVALAARAGLARAARPVPPVPDEALPAVAVVVAARDEAATVGGVLDALAGQDYPPERLTVVLADDGSTDDTGVRVRAHPLARAGRLRVVDVPQAPGAHPLPPGKARALAVACEGTPGALLLFTDADCVPPPGWARAHAAAFAADARLGALGGPAYVRPRPGRWAPAQTLDLALGAAVTAGLGAWGRPPSAMGNDLGVRRAAYDAVGGYAGVPFSVTEDHALVQAVGRAGYRTRYALDPALVLATRPAPTFRAVLRQRVRWAAGGTRGGPAVWALYAVVFGAHTAALVGLAGGTLLPLGLKVAADLVLLARARRGFDRPLPWGHLGAFEVLAFAYVLATPFGLLGRGVDWKGRRFGP